MADKVDYGKITLDFPTIMKKLHDVALENAKGIRGDLELHNDAFGDDGRFQGAAEYRLWVKQSDNQEIPDGDKDICLKFIKEYVKYFVGEDAAKLLKKEDLQPMVDLSKEESTAPESSGPVSESSSKPRNITFMSRQDRFIFESLDKLFEAAPPPPSGDDGDEPGDEHEDDPGEEQEKQVGFTVEYAIDIAGQQRKSIGEIFKRKTKGLFGGIMADLRNMEIKTLGGGSIKVGKMFDPAKWKEAVGIVDINIDTVDNNLQKIIVNDYKTSSAIVRCFDKDSLIELLRRQRKSTPEIEKKIKSANYSVTIAVEKRDPAYEQFTKEKIADICTRGFGTAMKLTNWNKVTEKDVIQIDDWESLHKTKSIYDVRRNNQTDSSSSTSGTPRGSVKENQTMYIVKGGVVESIMSELFGKDVIYEEILTEASRHPYNHIINLIFAPYIKKHGSTKFKWDKNAVDSAFEAHYRGQKNAKEIKQKLDQMSGYSDINELSANPPISDFKDMSSKDDSRIVITDAIFKCIKQMFENSSPPSEESEDEPPPEENNKISVDFMKKDPSKDDSEEELIKTLTREKDERFDDKDYPTNDEIKYDGFQFKRWNPDPNSLTENGKVSAEYLELENALSIQFFYKDPTNSGSSEKIAGTLVGKKADIGNWNSDGIKSRVPSFDGYILSTWNPDPNSLTEDSFKDSNPQRVDAGFSKTDGKQVSAQFWFKNPTQDNKQNRLLSVLTMPYDDLGNKEFDLDGVNEKIGQMDFGDYRLSTWNPDPNDFGPDNIDNSLVIKTYAVFTNETDNISVRFWYKDPTRENSVRKLISSLVIEPSQLGNIQLSGISSLETFPSFDGYMLSGWNPDPNDYDTNNLEGNVIDTYAMFVKDRISIEFVEKNPLKSESEPIVLTTLTAFAGDFSSISSDFPNVRDRTYEDKYKKQGFEFKGWTPEPNSLTSDGQVSAIFKEKEEKEGGNTARLFIIPHKRLTSQNRPNKEETYDDGTVKAKTSDQEYKPTDMRM